MVQCAFVETSVVEYIRRNPAISVVGDGHYCIPVAHRHRFCLIAYMNDDVDLRQIVASVVHAVVHRIFSNRQVRPSAILVYQNATGEHHVHPQVVVACIHRFNRRQQDPCVAITVARRRVKSVWHVSNHRTRHISDDDQLRYAARKFLVAPPFTHRPRPHDLANTTDLAKVQVFVTDKQMAIQ
ncbi:MAG: hypothetical protein JPMHGGIA_00716 [Saprospiraceae bacterium]|nr:hypothetical protein [Saprospiraceae bacterium]